MPRLIHIISAICLLTTSQVEAQTREHAYALTDKDCYVAGERLHVSVRITDDQGRPSTLSRVAYVEVSDTAAMQAQGMVSLKDGTGWGDIALPPNLHSGCYTLSVYTRKMRNDGTEFFHRQLIGIVNTQHVTRRDEVLFHDPRSQEQDAMPVRRYQAGREVSVSLPATIQTLSVIRSPLDIQLYEAPALRPLIAPQTPFIPEMEGHIMLARPEGESQPEKSMLAGIGKGTMLFDGRRSADGTWYYLTHGLTGRLAVTLHADQSSAMTFLSPYAGVRPSALPKLEVWCTEEGLRQRSIGAQQEHVLTQWTERDTLQHSTDFMSRQPEFFYDVTEYTRFNTVQEALVEYVKGVQRRVVEGQTSLYTRDADDVGFNRLPALVLLDGMPVTDVDRILTYDSRLLKYIQVYSGSFTLGSTTFHGVISLITHHGLLSNYQLDEHTRLFLYDFPQDHPDFHCPDTPETSTVLWNPAVNATHTTFSAPSLPGRYQVLLQGWDSEGASYRSTMWIEVE